MNKSFKNIYNLYLRSPLAPAKDAIKPMEEFVRVQDDGIISHVGFEELNEALDNSENKTLLQMFQSKVLADGDRRIFGTIQSNKTILYESYKSIDIQARRLALFLETITKEREIIGIASTNRKEWLVAEYATYYSNCINSPVYTTFSPNILASLIEKTKMDTIVASESTTSYLIDSVLDLCESHKFKRIILLDDNDEAVEKCKKKGIEVNKLSEIYSQYDIDSPSPTRNQPGADDLATICFTSGTGGNPKGVELTHRNFMAQLEGFAIGSKKYGIIQVNTEDCYLSYLPLAHVLERICVCICIQSGAKIGFFRGNYKLIQEDYKIIRPTFVPAVPKVLQTFYEEIEKKVMKESLIKRMIYRIGMKYKIFKQRFGIYDSFIWDNLVFKKVAGEFGGRIRGCLCGGASISEDLIQYMQCVLSAKIFQGYGQTEGLGANTLCTFSSTDVSSIGIPFITTQLKLIPIEEFPDSQKLLCMRGPSITRGYYNDVKATDEAFSHGDGWLETGDVVEFRNNKLYAVGRRNDMFKLGNGEYISPENAEDLLNGRRIPDVDDLYIAMKMKKIKPVLLIVCKNKNADHQKIINAIKKEMKVLSDGGLLNRFLSFHDYIFTDKDFASCQFNNQSLVTNTMKKRRKIIYMYFEKQIDQVYED